MKKYGGASGKRWDGGRDGWEPLLWYSGRDIYAIMKLLWRDVTILWFELTINQHITVTIKIQLVKIDVMYKMLFIVCQLTLHWNASQSKYFFILWHNIYCNKSHSVSKVWVAFHGGENITSRWQCELWLNRWKKNPEFTASVLSSFLSDEFVHLCKLITGYQPSKKPI